MAEDPFEQAAAIYMDAHGEIRDILNVLPIRISLANPFVEGATPAEAWQIIQTARALIREVPGITDEVRASIQKALLDLIAMHDVFVAMMMRQDPERLTVILHLALSVRSSILNARTSLMIQKIREEDDERG